MDGLTEWRANFVCHRVPVAAGRHADEPPVDGDEPAGAGDDAPAT